MLGTRTEPFKLSKLKEFIQNENVDEAKNYVLSYFAKIHGSPLCIAMYLPDRRSFTLFTESDIKKRYLTKKMSKKMSTGLFSIQEWFFDEVDDEYMFGNRVNGDFIYEERGRAYINLFKGFKHKKKPYNEYPDEIKEGVECFLNHIKEVLCSGNNVLYHYTLKWLSCVIGGRKMRTFLYFNALEGAGKSIFTEFIQDNVLGIDICHITKDASVLLDFNAEMIGIILLVLEEVKADSKREWMNIQDSLKHWSTGTTITIKEKYKTPVEVKNITSIILTSNNKAIKVSETSRRDVCLDVSEDRIEDWDYFNNLRKYNNDNVGEAFYNYLLEYFENIDKEYNEFIIPKTNKKKELVIENLNPLYQFIKDEFISEKKGIDMRFCDLIGLKHNNGCMLTRPEMSKLLQRIGLKLKQRGDGKRYIVASYEYLLETFKEKGWIHETDDIDVGVEHVTKINVVEKKSRLDRNDFNDEENNIMEMLNKTRIDLSPKKDDGLLSLSFN